ncbi:MAG TPA: heavy metal-binding domain-containing protein [Rhizomicrobium sp.]|nr:heavy metal-binding domain-containing protein [Rhizomicrobium sp.]
MIVATAEGVAGYRAKQTLGQCFGVVVRSRGLGGNIMAGLRSIVGGEIHEYTQLLEEARRHAVDRLVRNATVMGANGVIMMRFDSAEIGQTMSEIVAYGTAVILEPVDAKTNAA